jgi:hypothetical protein
MTHEQMIFSLLGLAATLMIAVGGIVRWALGQVEEKINYVLGRFDDNTEKVMNRFENITEKMNEALLSNEKEHYAIGSEIILLKNEIDRCHTSCPLKGGNGVS